MWNKELKEGPLKTITRSQSEKLGLALRNLDRDVVVDWAMRYGAPPIARATEGASGRGLRPHSGHSALSSILRRFDCDGRRQGVRGAQVDALAAGDSRGGALLRRSRLYRCARPLRSRSPRQSRLRTRSRARLLSRHSASLFRQGRSLCPPLRRNDAALARGAGHERGAPAHDVSVALRPRRMAEALYFGDHARPRFARRQACGGLNARFRRRLPGDAGGNRASRTRAIFARPAASVSPRSRASTTSPTAWR